MNNPLVSIAMATYNGERFLREQIDSILSQTITDWELHVCDDCSSDGTLKILNDYAMMDNRIHVHCNEQNLGFKRNFEKAISFCSGDYIAFSDQDDVWLPNHIEFLLNQIGDKVLAGGNAMLVDSDGKDMNCLLNELFGFLFFPEGSCFLWRIIFGVQPIQGASILMKREAVLSFLPIPQSVSYHDSWLVACASLCGGISYSSTVITKYRQHDKNVTFSDNHASSRSLTQRIVNDVVLFFKGLVTDKISYIDELRERFNPNDENFTNISTCIGHFQQGRISARDIKTLWNNYYFIITQKSHKGFVKNIIKWFRLKDNRKA